MTNESKIKNLEIKDYRRFKNFTGAQEEFCKFNLIYGWNYSGKTTLSRIFANFDGKPFDESHSEEGEYTFLLSDGNKLEKTDSDKLTIRVFNSDYITNNIFFEKNRASNVIVVTDGAEAIVNEIKTLEEEKEKIANEHAGFAAQLKEQDQIYKDCRYETAKKISEDLKLVRFNASNLPDIHDTDLEQCIEKNLDSLNSNIKTLTDSSLLNAIDEIKIDLTPNFSTLYTTLEKVVTPSDALKELQEKNADEWVKAGINIHKQLNKCLFCGGDITKELLSNLDEIFSTKYDDFDTEISLASREFKEINIELPSVSVFSPHLRDSYMLLYEKFYTTKAEYNKRINAIQKIISTKRKLKHLKMTPKFSFDFSNIQKIISNIDDLRKEHNNFIQNEQTEKAKLKEKVINHYVATMCKSMCYLNAVKLIAEAKIGMTKTQETLREKMTEIEAKKAQISNVHKGAEKINEVLSLLFMGNPTIKLVVENDNDENGQQIEVTRLYRQDYIAENLSEGEKSSIAFAHFMAKINDDIETENAKDNILFIDDPISSLDHNHIYSVFMLIRKIESMFNQSFVSTHNFELFRLFAEKLKTSPKNRNGTIIPPRDRIYYIKRQENDSVITKLPDMLIKHKTEYNFLFHNLLSFKNNQEEDLFTIGHSARRFLEIYANTKRPTNEDLRTKLENIFEERGTDTTVATIIYKIVNDESHTHNPKTFDKSYMLQTICTILDFVQNADPTVYECLENSCQ